MWPDSNMEEELLKMLKCAGEFMDYSEQEKDDISQNLFIQLQETKPIIFQENLQILDSSDRTCNSSFKAHTSSGYGGRRNGSRERELLFEKIVTPSDVGKLNRLVIPKQFAEKHFPLHSSTNEKGLFLTFEDRNGQQWRFRYSYWKSSQSFVITKGWSRFVKDKQLHAGDVVSFERCLPETGKNDRHFWIDWKHRLNTVLPQGDLYFNRNLHDFKQTNFGFDSFCNVDPLSTTSQSSSAKAAMESVPLIRHCRSSEANPKRLRLFGVNLECPEEPKLHHFSPFDSSSVSHIQANLPRETPLLEISAQFSSTGKDPAFFPFHWDP